MLILRYGFFGGGQAMKIIVAKDFSKEEAMRFHQQRQSHLAICGGFQLLWSILWSSNGEKSMVLCYGTLHPQQRKYIVSSEI